MSDILLHAIPADRLAAVRAALAAAFGSAAPTAISPVTGGASGALIYRVEVGGRPYLLRLETGPDPHGNPRRGFACMRIAAEAGVAPRLHHADPETGVAVMDFVAQRPLEDYPGGPEGLARALGALVGRLQSTPTSPPLADYPVMIDRMLAMVAGAGVFAPGLLDPHRAGLARIHEAYPWDGAALVSSHNDPNPTNILFDGERLWLIDWQTGCRNDPLADVAILADNFAPTPELEDALLTAWLGRSPDATMRAKLTLMRVLTRLYYAGLIFSLFIGRAPPETDLSAPTPDAFRQGVAEGRIVIGGPETLRLLGKMSLAGALAGMQAPGFEEALVVARRG